MNMNMVLNIVLPLADTNLNNVQFLPPVKNTIIELNTFARLLYSTALFTVKGIYVRTQIHYTHYERIFGKYRCFLMDNEEGHSNNIGILEQDLLKLYASTITKNPVFKIAEQLCSGFINIVSDKVLPGGELVLKIYGIWENDMEYGLTYTFDTC